MNISTYLNLTPLPRINRYFQVNMDEQETMLYDEINIFPMFWLGHHRLRMVLARHLSS